MFKKPEDVRMTEEEAAKYGRDIDAQNALYEKVEVQENVVAMSADEIPPPITEEEIINRVGEQNFKNMKEGGDMNSINS